VHYLLIVSIIWGFSFGIIKHQLVGLGSSYVSFIRLFLSAIVFLPFLRLKDMKLKTVTQLALIGAIQFGLMYLCYIESFRYLESYEVALYTVFTPIYVIVFYGLLKREIHLLYTVSAVLAVIAGLLMNYKLIHLPNSFFGFILVQLSNLAFAFGQVNYKLIDLKGVKQHQIFALLYLGGSIVAFIPALFKSEIVSVNMEQFLALVYLGVVSSALCFFLWSVGSKKTNAGNLSVFNNLKVPIAVLISVLIFKERVDMNVLLSASLIFAIALVLNELPFFKSWFKKRK